MLRKYTICDPQRNTQSAFNVTDCSQMCYHLVGKKLGATIAGEVFSPSYKGYVFKITSGNDREGFPMRQGILTDKRVKILMRCSRKSTKAIKSKDQRIRRTARGCIIGKDIVSLSLTIIQHGSLPIRGVTDTVRPNNLGPKRAGKIREMFQLDKEDDVKKYVPRRQLPNGKTKAPKIQRLVTKERIKRKKTIAKIKEERLERKNQLLEDFKSKHGSKFSSVKLTTIYCNK